MRQHYIFYNSIFIFFTYNLVRKNNTIYVYVIGGRVKKRSKKNYLLYFILTNEDICIGVKQMSSDEHDRINLYRCATKQKVESIFYAINYYL